MKALWIYNMNLPKFTLGKDKSPNLVYEMLMKTLDQAAQAKLAKYYLPHGLSIPQILSKTRQWNQLYKLFLTIAVTNPRPSLEKF